MAREYIIPLRQSTLPQLVGPQDVHFRSIQRAVQSRLVLRGENISVLGPEEEEKPLRNLFHDLEDMVQRGGLDRNGLETAMRLAGISPEGPVASTSAGEEMIFFERRGMKLAARSEHQAQYIQAAREADLVFAVGPAGTGKTYLAVAMAVRALLEDEVDRIILVRPAVEAGEHLGYLPGDLRDKVEPYFQPLYDALMDMLTPEKLRRHMDQGRVEVAPLAYMRGRTLNNAFVILDEAQNTTSEQLKMFLTRLGARSRAIITGDLTQIDLVDKTKSGLPEALEILRGIRGIRFITLDHTDVVRHKLVREIIKAYDSNGKPRERDHGEQPS